MRDFMIRRTLQALAVMLCISAITFFVLNVVPGDPVRIMLGDMASEEALQTVRHRMGLDQPIGVQYVSWLTNMLRGDFVWTIGRCSSTSAGLSSNAKTGSFPSR